MLCYVMINQDQTSFLLSYYANYYLNGDSATVMTWPFISKIAFLKIDWRISFFFLKKKQIKTYYNKINLFNSVKCFGV